MRQFRRLLDNFTKFSTSSWTSHPQEYSRIRLLFMRQCTEFGLDFHAFFVKMESDPSRAVHSGKSWQKTSPASLPAPVWSLRCLMCTGPRIRLETTSGDVSVFGANAGFDSGYNSPSGRLLMRHLGPQRRSKTCASDTDTGCLSFFWALHTGAGPRGLPELAAPQVHAWTDTRLPLTVTSTTATSLRQVCVVVFFFCTCRHGG